LLPFQPEEMSPAHLAAVSFFLRYAGRTLSPYAYQLRRWFGWCEANGLDPLVGIQALTSSHTSDTSRVRSDGLVGQQGHARRRGFFRFAHIAGLIPHDPAVYARLPRYSPTPAPRSWTDSN
jgi:integrase/recombinase XerD